jgi:hypothetical protein
MKTRPFSYEMIVVSGAIEISDSDELRVLLHPWLAAQIGEAGGLQDLMVLDRRMSPACTVLAWRHQGSQVLQGRRASQGRRRSGHGHSGVRSNPAQAPTLLLRRSLGQSSTLSNAIMLRMVDHLRMNIPELNTLRGVYLADFSTYPAGSPSGSSSVRGRFPPPLRRLSRSQRNRCHRTVRSSTELEILTVQDIGRCCSNRLLRRLRSSSNRRRRL